ncbi:MAG TPA: TonB-dependent receptor [Gemmatimonadales bacterium]|jgi:iron complex outermembrane receptor protein
MSLRHVLVLGLLMTPHAVRAQAPARVVGRVIDATTGAPLGSADVRVGELRTTTGVDGTFVLGGVAPGRRMVDVRRIGYAPSLQGVDIVPGLDRTLTIDLRPLPVRLDSIAVVATPGTISISGDELLVRGRDLAHALDGWEGMAVRRTGSAGPASPQLRGGGPDEVLVLVDGFAVNDPLTGRADLTRISSREVDRVTLLPGAQTVRAGSRAIAGVLVVDTRRALRPDGSAWLASHGARGFRLGVSAGSLDVTASTERYADRFPYTIPEVRGGGVGSRLNAGGDLSSVSLRLDGPIEISLRGTSSDRGLPGTTTNPTLTAHARDHTLFAGARGSSIVEWSGSLAWLETRAADPGPPTGPAYDSYTHGAGATLEVGHRVAARFGGWTGDAGAATEVRGDRFAGDGVRPGSSFTHAALRADATVHRGGRAVWTIAPAVRLDAWTGQRTPRVSARVDAGWHRGATGITAAFGSAVTPPVLSDLLFREGVGVRLNPDLRPERVRWEAEAGVRRDLGLGTASVRFYYGRVADMVVWAPDFRFIWSPRNFDVLRRGGEVSLGLRPTRTLRLDGSAAYAAVTYDIPGGSQVQYRPRATYSMSALWTPMRWSADARWRRIGERFPNSAGTNPRPAFSVIDIGLEHRFADVIGVRLQVDDLTDARAEFIAGYPTPGRTYTATLNLELP